MLEIKTTEDIMANHQKIIIDCQKIGKPTMDECAKDYKKKWVSLEEHEKDKQEAIDKCLESHKKAVETFKLLLAKAFDEAEISKKEQDTLWYNDTTTFYDEILFRLDQAFKGGK